MTGYEKNVQNCNIGYIDQHRHFTAERSQITISQR